MEFNKTFTKVIFTKKEMKGILRNLKAMYKWLEKPGVWVKGEYLEEYGGSVYDEKLDEYVKVDHPTMCLMGANDLVDGPAEANTNVFMCFNLPEPYLKKYLRDIKTAAKDCEDWDGVIDKNDFFSSVYSCSDGREDGEGYVEEFNDAYKTTLKTVLTWLNKLIKKAERLAA